MKTRNSIKICWLTDCYVNRETKDNISAGSCPGDNYRVTWWVLLRYSGFQSYSLHSLLCAQSIYWLSALLSSLVNIPDWDWLRLTNLLSYDNLLLIIITVSASFSWSSPPWLDLNFLPLSPVAVKPREVELLNNRVRLSIPPQPTQNS